jgi:hypothetical protein
MSEPIKRVIWSPDGDWAQWELCSARCSKCSLAARAAAAS